jgi:spore maturation protein CgeB
MSTPQDPMRIVVFGLAITSSWGNGHATTYRSLVKGLVERGHQVVFYERRRPWYEANRDLRHSNLCEIVQYDSIADLDTLLGAGIDADLLLIGSYVPEGARLAEWALERTNAITAFYDIDTPVTLAALAAGGCEYLTRALVPEFDLYFSFSGGPILKMLERQFGARDARPLYCSVDPDEYFRLPVDSIYDLGYLGTYSADRQPKLEALLTAPARQWPAGRFCVAGPQYPAAIRWPANVIRIDHVAPTDHCRFYNSQRFTLNVTRRDMVESGYSPSVRLFEAAACGVPVISDPWNGLDEFFVPGEEILIARTPADVLRILHETGDVPARKIGDRARARILREHTSQHRAEELERYVRGYRRPAVRTLEHEAPVTCVTGATLH